MTSPALIVLFLAHAFSYVGTAPDAEADHDLNPKTMVTHKQWTTSYKPNLYNINNNKPKIVEDEIYTDFNDIQSTNGFVNRHIEDETIAPRVINNFYENVNKDNIISVTEEHKVIQNFRVLNEGIQFNKYKESTNPAGIKHFNPQVTDIAIAENTRNVKELRAIQNSKVRTQNSLLNYEKKRVNEGKIKERRRVKRQNDPCAAFTYDEVKGHITHPFKESSDLYANNTDCTTVITVPEGHVIELTFVDKFRIEYHPDCAYDYLEIRDGKQGYSDLLGHVCGQAFPRVMKTKGPYAWLKFHSDDTIEYEGFNIKVTQIKDLSSYSTPPSCYVKLPVTDNGEIVSDDIDDQCNATIFTHGLDILWTIETPPDTKIFLNFTEYELGDPNECDKNGIQIFGEVLELSAKLEYYCGSVANPVLSKAEKPERGNIMHIRMYTTKAQSKTTSFKAKYTAFRTINPAIESDACLEDEFDCADNTCIKKRLKCNLYADCRLKTDEDPDLCKDEEGSPIKQTHILVILIIFSLILSGILFVFFFKCTRKLYQDHKLIKEHIRQSCEDRLDRIDSLDNRLTLNAKHLQRDSEPRASLERENHANEMFKRKRDSFSKRQPTSIDSDFQDTHLDIDEEIWRRDVEQTQPDEILIERNGKRRRDTSKREESLKRSNERGSMKRSNEREKGNRDASVGVPDTKESGCQTRESLFQADPAPSSDGKSSSSNSRGFSTFGYSGATIARPSPPTNTSEITIELLKQVPRQESVKPQKKSDRRPMSTETTRSAPDVIIVSKPIR